jgi:predicted DNA-binding protein with PD1-like motif
MEGLTTHAFRLLPGEDLKQGIQAFAMRTGITAGWIATCVGSLTDYVIRFADQPVGTNGSGRFEIVSLTGTISIHGSHLHLGISDNTGKTIGGHLLEGCRMYTTAEIVIQCTSQLEFRRMNDGSTPWEELQVIHLVTENLPTRSNKN